MTPKFFEKIYSFGIIPVIEIDNADFALPLAEALLSGGLPVAEITLRTEAAIEVIRKIANKMPALIVGAGTVINREQTEAVIDAGAQFIVSPGLSKSVIESAQAHHISVIPGAVTPTEIMQAIDFGLKYLKFFPSETMGGLGALRSIGAPFPGIDFIPTGGINMQNLKAYLQTSKVHAVGGSWMANRKAIADCQFEEIRNNTMAAVEIVNQIRK